jgi:hypothetical protein
MALPITVPFTFGNATTTQSLSSLDADFSTVYNAVNGIGNGTVSLANVSITGGTISANLSASGIFSGTSNVSITSANGPVSINTNGNNAVYVNTSGNVGIGTTSPASVAGYTLLTLNSSTTGSGVYLQLAGTTVGSFTTNSGGTTLATATAVPLIFYTNNAEGARIDPTGNLLVGTTGVIGSSNAIGQFLNVNGGRPGIAIGNSGGSSATNAIVFINSNGTVGSIQTSASATSYVTSSDYRLKNTIAPITNGLDTVNALLPVRYDWKIDGVQGEGFIAHELQKIIPLAVTGAKDAVDADGNPIYQGVDYSKIVVHLVAAIQELSAKNDALETRLSALESK